MFNFNFSNYEYLVSFLPRPNIYHCLPLSCLETSDLGSRRCPLRNYLNAFYFVVT
jgi:hypothetical protein